MRTYKISPLRSISIILSLFAAPALLFCVLQADADTNAKPTAPEVLVLRLNGVINPSSAEFVVTGIEKAAAMKAEAVVIQLDTPGGLDSSMRIIVKKILSSSVPVVVYVSPTGARAASAGVFITLAANIAAMAPGTNMGAAHPVSVGGKLDKVMSDKVANDAAAYIKSIAVQRGKNAVWAEEAVRKSVSITENDALKNRVIDLVAKDMDSLLKAIDGKVVKTGQGERKLNTANAKIIVVEMGLRHRILNIISDPTVAYLLMLLGFYGLFFELTNPGALLPGIVGSICLVLAFYAFQTLPVNYAGLLLIIIGIVLFLMEVKVPSYGLLTAGGIVSITLGSLMMFESPLPFLRVSLAVILPSALVTALFFVLTFRLAYRAQKRKPLTGTEGLLGIEGVATAEVGPSGGMVRVRGEIWSAWSDAQVSAGDKVVVEAVSGLRLKVSKKGA